MQRLPLLAAIVTTSLIVCGCGRKPTFQPPAGHVTPDNASIEETPLGNPPGRSVTVASEIKNPLEGDANAVLEGRALFRAMNCSYCHGFGATGLIGPSLNSRAWRYGGAPAEIYKSIHDGRPQGMPAWGDRLPPQEIWKLVAYIEALGGASPPATGEMTKFLPPTESATGAQPAEQDPADTANQSRVQSNSGGHASSGA